jgi:WD domain, G-beta repeat
MELTGIVSLTCVTWTQAADNPLQGILGRSLRRDLTQRVNILHLGPWTVQYVRAFRAYGPQRLTKLIVLWRTYGSCDNYGILTGHKGAVLDLHWSRDSRVIFSASADMMMSSWDLETGMRIRRHVGHEEVINCMDVSRRGEEVLVSGSDDGYIGVSTSTGKLPTRRALVLHFQLVRQLTDRLLNHRFGTQDRKKRSNSLKRNSQ